MALFLLPQRGDHSRGDLFSAFRETKDTQSILLASAVSYGTLIQSNQYAKVTYSGMACPGPHPFHLWKKKYSVMLQGQVLRSEDGILHALSTSSSLGVFRQVV